MMSLFLAPHSDNPRCPHRPLQAVWPKLKMRTKTIHKKSMYLMGKASFCECGYGDVTYFSEGVHF